jgi:hypothetical protein
MIYQKDVLNVQRNVKLVPLKITVTLVKTNSTYMIINVTKNVQKELIKIMKPILAKIVKTIVLHVLTVKIVFYVKMNSTYMKETVFPLVLLDMFL